MSSKYTVNGHCFLVRIGTAPAGDARCLICGVRYADTGRPCPDGVGSKIDKQRASWPDGRLCPTCPISEGCIPRWRAVKSCLTLDLYLSQKALEDARARSAEAEWLRRAADLEDAAGGFPLETGVILNAVRPKPDETGASVAYAPPADLMHKLLEQRSEEIRAGMAESGKPLRPAAELLQDYTVVANPIGRPVSRQEALDMSRETLLRAEAARLPKVEPAELDGDTWEQKVERVERAVTVLEKYQAELNVQLAEVMRVADALVVEAEERAK